ncbi:MAG: FimV/HubP family polar landmark protein [Gallionellaceae bacterium]|nr:FimV/HubP family polar landmark protein [Gallionellaceae bacterium]
MRKSFLKAFGYFVCLAWSSTTYAVGFGGINVTSALGQPLVAEIELVAVEAADKSTLNARLASPEAFKGAGIDFPYGLPKLKFSLETRANGDAYIKATSTQPINEPFVSLLIELGWSSGRLLREYTFLLDPPGFIAEQAAVVKPIEPVVVPPVVAVAPSVEPVPQSVVATPAATSEVVQPVAAETTQAAVEAVPAPTPAVEPAPTPAPVKEEVKAAVAPVKQKVETTPTNMASVTVKRGDTLGKIAAATKATDVSLERMLVALYRANAEAFEGKNMNRLSTGKILRMPEAEALAKLQQAEAANEIRAQVSDWNAYRQKLAAATGSVKEQRAKQEVAGKISTTLTDKAPEAKEPPKEVLKLSKGEAASDKAVAGNKEKAAADKAMAKGEEAIAKAKSLKEAEQRTAMLEKSVKDMQRLVELKNQAAAAQAGQGKLAASAPASALPLVASTVMPASPVAAASEVVAAKPKVIAPKVVAPPPSMLDDILANPIYLGGGAAALLGIGALVFMRLRGKKGEKPVAAASVEDIGSASSRIAAPIAPSPETGDFTNASDTPAVAIGDAEEVDPIGEADLFLNFGRDAQAEEVLKEALKKDPSNNPVKLKLLSIYATRKDTKSFYVYALEVKESGDATAWEKAAEMGRALEPNNSIYGGAGEQSAVALDEADSGVHAVDFDLGFGDATDEPAVMDTGSIEPESNNGESTVIMTATELREAQEAPMDFDITGTHPGIKAVVEEEPQTDVAAMDFDLTVAPPVASAVTEEPKLDMPAMDFDLSALESKAPADASSVTEEKSPAMNLDDLVFDVTSSHASMPEVAQSAPVAGLDQGMEFTLDIPTEARVEEAAKPAPMDVGLSEISLNLDEPEVEVSPATSEPKGEQWQEVATKLDLAKAYQEMGDQDGAREILEEVVRDGDEQQRETAESLLKQLL